MRNSMALVAILSIGATACGSTTAESASLTPIVDGGPDSAGGGGYGGDGWDDDMIIVEYLLRVEQVRAGDPAESWTLQPWSSLLDATEDARIDFLWYGTIRPTLSVDFRVQNDAHIPPDFEGWEIGFGLAPTLPAPDTLVLATLNLEQTSIASGAGTYSVHWEFGGTPGAPERELRFEGPVTFRIRRFGCAQFDVPMERQFETTPPEAYEDYDFVTPFCSQFEGLRASIAAANLAFEAE